SPVDGLVGATDREHERIRSYSLLAERHRRRRFSGCSAYPCGEIVKAPWVASHRHHGVPASRRFRGYPRACLPACAVNDDLCHELLLSLGLVPAAVTNYA